jgi:hypothetical protein
MIPFPFLRYSIALPAAFIIFLLISACTTGNSDTTDTQYPFSAKLVKAADSADLVKRLKAELVRRFDREYTSYLYGGGGILGRPADPTAPGTTQTGGPSSSSGSADTKPHSETNVQETGVDEGDLVKTDGSCIYLARGSHFFILTANPADQTAIVSDIDLQEPISELHLSDGRVSVITARYGLPVMGGAIATPYAMTRPVTNVYVYDVMTPASPVLTAHLTFPGSLQGSRRINNTLYLVTNYAIDLPDPVSPWDYLPAGSDPDQNTFDNACSEARKENLARINALTLEDMLPSYAATVYTGGAAGSPSTAPAVSPGDLYVPEFGNGTDLSLVISIDTSAPIPAIAASGILSSWCSIYMTPDSLYLASGNDWLWIAPIPGAFTPQANPEPRTAIHKFSVNGSSGSPLYRGSGVVDGWINDRFSMGDYQGYLRIGTTRGGWWGEGISNQLAVLAEKDGGLSETGRITGLAPGERIYSMRFDGVRGYMVTFRQTDPLFTFDLSDPTDPRVAGQIIVNGFATYIHLLGGSSPRLLTIGRSADATGRVTGNKLQLFDVSDLVLPRHLGDYELGAGWSQALYDPHAFLYYDPLGILAIPYFASGDMPSSYTSGLNVFTVGPASISLRGVITAGTVTTGYGSYNDTVDRAVIIGSDIFSIAHRTVTAAGAELLDVKKTVDLSESYSYGPLVFAPSYNKEALITGP